MNYEYMLYRILLSPNIVFEVLWLHFQLQQQAAKTPIILKSSITPREEVCGRDSLT